MVLFKGTPRSNEKWNDAEFVCRVVGALKFLNKLQKETPCLFVFGQDAWKEDGRELVLTVATGETGVCSTLAMVGSPTCLTWVGDPSWSGVPFHMHSPEN